MSGLNTGLVPVAGATAGDGPYITGSGTVDSLSFVVKRVGQRHSDVRVILGDIFLTLGEALCGF